MFWLILVKFEVIGIKYALDIIIVILFLFIILYFLWVRKHSSLFLYWTSLLKYDLEKVEM